MRLKELNEFLVLGKRISVVQYNLESAGNGQDNFAYEVFSGGESINLRILKSGLASVGDLPLDFERTLEYIQAVESNQANNLISGKNGSDQKIPPMGCGTLPCRK